VGSGGASVEAAGGELGAAVGDPNTTAGGRLFIPRSGEDVAVPKVNTLDGLEGASPGDCGGEMGEGEKEKAPGVGAEDGWDFSHLFGSRSSFLRCREAVVTLNLNSAAPSGSRSSFPKDVAVAKLKPEEEEVGEASRDEGVEAAGFATNEMHTPVAGLRLMGMLRHISRAQSAMYRNSSVLSSAARENKRKLTTGVISSEHVPSGNRDKYEEGVFCRLHARYSAFSNRCSNSDGVPPSADSCDTRERRTRVTLARRRSIHHHTWQPRSSRGRRMTGCLRRVSGMGM
jgi:hypothetical protein